MALGRRKIGFIIIMTVGLGLVGLIFGYLMFGRFLGEYLSLGELLAPADNVLEEIGKQLSGIKSARQNVFIAGGIGAVAGLILGFVLKRRR
jgi:hypothetical protein